MSDRLKCSAMVVGVVALACVTLESPELSDAGSFGFSSTQSTLSSFSVSSTASIDATPGFSLVLTQILLLAAARSPFLRRKITYAIGPERYSFSRIEREMTGTATCKDFFRFELKHLRRLKRALRFPEDVVIKRYEPRTGKEKTLVRATGEEAMLLMLRRLSFPCKWTVLAMEAGRSVTQLSILFHWSIHHVHENFSHLRDSRSIESWEPQFERFAKTINRGGKRPNSKAGFRSCPVRNCVAFLDGSNQFLDRPSIFQHVLYNGHKLLWQTSNTEQLL